MKTLLSTLALTTLLASPVLAQTTAPAPTAAAPAAPAAAAPAAGTIPTDAAAPAGEISGTYTFDPDHSQILFSYDHQGFSRSHGFINGVTGQVTLDQANPANSSVEAQFPLSALHTVSASLDEHIMGDMFFKGAAPATAVTFKSTSVEPQGPDRANVMGDLTLNGQTKPVTLQVQMLKAGANPMSQQPTVGFAITGSLLRSDFGLGALAPAVSDEVQVEISVEASKS